MSKVTYFTGGYTEATLMGSGEIVPGRGEGLVQYEFEQESGKLKKTGRKIYTPNPSFALVSPDKPYIYCVNELKEYHGVEGSTVSAYEICEETKELRPINSQFTTGADACFLAFSPENSHIIAANYSGGSIAVFPVRKDGGLEPASCVLRHQGHGPNPERQEGPHPHQILLSPDGAYVYVPDLGLDRLVCYKADWKKGWLMPCEERDICGNPGQGNRHAVFDAAGEHLYVVTELTQEVNVYTFDKETGEAELVQTVSALPRNEAEKCGVNPLGAAIRLHPTGKWLYVSVRFVNVLSAFAVKEDGTLELMQILPSGGEIPRDFVLSPNGKYLLAAHQDTDNICIFEICQESGRLKWIGEEKDARCVTVLA